MKSKKQILYAIEILSEKAEHIELENGKKIRRPATDSGWAIYGDRIDALKWVLGNQDTIAGLKI